METTIKQWVEDPKRSYSVGVALLDKHCANRCLVRYFQNTVERFGMRKLTYELKKLALKVNEPEPIEPSQTPTVMDTPPADEGETTQMVDTPPTDEGSTTQMVDTPPSDNEKPPIPEVAAIAKGIVHDTWVELSRIKEEIFNLGTENTPDIIARRKALLEEQAPLVARYNEVYEAKEAFFAGEKTEEELLAVINQEHPKGDNKQPTDYSQLSDLKLTKRIKAVKQVINRSNNQLLYQQNTVAKTENPMPDCPRRRDIEQRILVSKAELETLTDIARHRGLIK